MSAGRKHKPTERRTPQRARSAILDSPWMPVVCFALLSVVYFSEGLFTDKVVLGSDSGVELHKGKEPFSEKLKTLPPADWSRYMGGMPKSSSLRAQYHPLTVIYLFTSQHRYFLWRYVIAMFCAGYFTFLCIRGFNLHPVAALLAGVAYACAPAFLSFTHAGHFAKMSAICLFPLLYWALDRGLETRRLIYFFIFAAVVGVGIYTPHLQIVFFSLLAVGLLFLFKLLLLYRRERDRLAALHRTLLAAGAVCFGLAIGADGLFPQYWNAKTVSKRAGKDQKGAGYDFAASWSLHPEEIAALIVPEFGGFDVRNQRYWGRNVFKINSEYVGIVVLFFAILALSRLRRDPRISFLLLLFLLAVSFSLGPHTPVHRLCYKFIPGMSVLRAPGMIAFLFSFAMCALAAFGLHRLLQPKPDVGPKTVKRLAVGGSVAALVLILAAFRPQTLITLWKEGVWPDMPSQKLQLARASLPDVGDGALLAALLVGLLTLLCVLRLRGQMQNAAFVVCLLGILLFDTWRVDRKFLRFVNPNRVLPSEQVNAGVLRFLSQDKALYRVLPLPHWRQVPLHGIDLVTGFHDFTIRRYDRILKSGDLNHRPILNLVNTKYIVSKAPLSLPRAPEVARLDGLHVYRNEDALPWFYLASGAIFETDEDRILERLRNPEHDPSRIALLEEHPSPAPGPQQGEAGQIQQIAYDPRRGFIELRVNAPGPRLLIISENYHPFWRAYVDGHERPVLRANYLWKAVPLHAGNHRVELRYEDPVVVVCRRVTLASTGLLIIGFAACIAGPRWHRRTSEARGDVRHA